MRIFYDVETQNDFMNPGAPLYCSGVEVIKPTLKKLTQYAIDNNILIAGGMDIHFGTEEYKHREIELQENGGPFPRHCMVGGEGLKKISETDFNGIRHPHFLDEHVDLDIIRKGIEKRGIIFEKQQYDIFTNPAITEFMILAKVTEAIVYGVLTDWCVKDAVLGMQNLGIQTYLVNEGIYAAEVNPGDTKKALEEMENAGAKFVTSKQVLEGKI